MRKITLLVFFLSLPILPSHAQGSPGPGGGFDLFGILDGVYNIACGQLLGSGVSLAGALQLGSFCYTYQSFRRFKGFDAYLQALGRSALKSLPGRLIDSTLVGLADGLRNNPGYQAFKGDFDGFMNGLEQVATQIYNLPHRLLFGLMDQLSVGISEGTYDAAREKTYTPPDTNLGGTLESFQSIIEDAQAAPPELREGFGYLDQRAVDESKRTHRETIRALEEVAQKAAIVAEKGTDLADAKVKAKEAAQKARDEAEAQYYDTVLNQQRRALKELTETAAKASLDNPQTREKGIVAQLKEEARNALSDRRLLELQVEAIATLLDYTGIYASKTAELLAEMGRSQLLATYQIVQEVRKAKAESESMVQAVVPSGEYLARTMEAQAARVAEESKALLSLVQAACLFYTGQDAQACD